MRDAVRGRVAVRKALRKSEISGGEAAKRSYWGTGKKIGEYQDAISDALDTEELESAIDSVTDNRRNEKVISESLIDDLVASLDFDALFDAAVVSQLEELVMESYKEGGSRLLTTDGDKLDPFDVSPRRIVDQLKGQEVYLRNLSRDAEERVRSTLEQGVEDGRTLSDMRDDIVNGVEDMTEQRAETIARSEITKASSKGTQQAMEEAGVETVQMFAEIDDRTCESGSFEWRGPDGTYTSCREWHREEFDREDAPTPVRDSHPNCRCALLVVTE